MTCKQRLILTLPLLCACFADSKEMTVNPDPGIRLHENIEAIISHEKGFVAVGVTSSPAFGHRFSSWMVTGPDPLSRSPLVEGAAIRDVVFLGEDRLAVVGEYIAEEEAGLFGHHLYGGIILTLNSAGNVLERRELGTPGPTGLKHVASVDGQVHAVGSQGFTGWWVTPDRESALDLDPVNGIRKDAGGVVMFGQQHATTKAVGVTNIRALTTDGQVRWQWRGPAESEIQDLQPRPNGGWLAVGRHGATAFALVLDENGGELLRQDLPLSGVLRGFALAVNAKGDFMACGVIVGEQFIPNIHCIPLNADGKPQGKPTSIGVGRVTGLVATDTGWWLAGYSHDSQNISQAMFWQLSSTGELHAKRRLAREPTE